MQGRQEYQQELFATINVEAMIPQNHLLRKLDRLLDLSFVREMTEQFYCINNGRPNRLWHFIMSVDHINHSPGANFANIINVDVQSRLKLLFSSAELTDWQIGVC